MAETNQGTTQKDQKESLLRWIFLTRLWFRRSSWMQPDHAISCNIMQCSVKNWNRSRMNHQRYQSLAEKPWSQVERTCDAAQTRENSRKSTVWWAQIGIGQKSLKNTRCYIMTLISEKSSIKTIDFGPWVQGSSPLAWTRQHQELKTHGWSVSANGKKNNHGTTQKESLLRWIFLTRLWFRRISWMHLDHAISCNIMQCSVKRTETGVAWTIIDIKAWLKLNDPRLQGHVTQHKHGKIMENQLFDGPRSELGNKS